MVATRPDLPAISEEETAFHLSATRLQAVQIIIRTLVVVIIRRTSIANQNHVVQRALLRQKAPIPQ